MLDNNTLIKELYNRNLIKQISNEESLNKIITSNKINLYCGFDATADSLHLGHLIPLICLKRFQMAGHKPFILLGGATSLIGDPSFKNKERILLSKNDIINWIEKIKNQISLFLNFNCGDNKAIIVNNYDWFINMNILSFLRNIGKHFSISHMINKESVKKRLSGNNNGISFTEFSYALMQSYDFAYLNKYYKVILQIGGSDQWGNISSGISLSRKLNNHITYGMTFPLITKSNGLKFGKTENGTIWLNKEKTSPYEFYQFWINIPDNKVLKYLKLLTFIPLKDIDLLKQKKNLNNNKNYFQYLLAKELTLLIHGENGLLSAQRITKFLFEYKNLEKLTKEDFSLLIKDGLPITKLKYGSDLLNSLLLSSLATSKSKAKNLISSNSIMINNKKQNIINYNFVKKDFLLGKYTFLKRGKKNFCLLCWY